jgi:prophage tail gpP-like protein
VGKPFETAQAQHGESILAFLDHLARQRGCLLWSDGTGQLVIGTPPPLPSGAVLKLGENIVSGKAMHSWADRYNAVTVVGQQKGDDQTNGEAASAPTAWAPDAEIDRYRPLTLIAEIPGGVKGLKARARYEVRSRKARGTRAEIHVKGWEAVPGSLWKPGNTVVVVDRFLGLDGEYSVATLTHSLDEKHGRTTKLELVVPGALQRALEHDDKPAKVEHL